jgi:YgiT-type zinc finger domain-containing protein
MPEPVAPHDTLAAWRAAHPAATLAEIEQTVDQHLSAQRAALIADLATAPAAARPACAQCGTPMHQNGTRTVTVTTAHEGRVPLTGPQYVCPACGAGLFPPR